MTLFLSHGVILVRPQIYTDLHRNNHPEVNASEAIRFCVFCALCVRQKIIRDYPCPSWAISDTPEAAGA